MKKIVLLFLCLITFALGAFANRTFSFKFDDSGYVSDNARVISETDSAVIAYWLKYLEDHKKISIILVTLDGLKGATASQVARYTLEHYGKNNKKEDTLIFVVSPFENKFGIEMGENLKSEISFATLRRIITDEIYPHFQSGHYSLALKKGVFAIASSIEPSLIFIKDVNPYKDSQKDIVMEPEKISCVQYVVLPMTLAVLVSMFIILNLRRRRKKVIIYPRCGFGVKFGEVIYEEY